MTMAEQLGFDGLLQAAEAENVARRFKRETAHLPGAMEQALPYYCDLIDRHHAAMLAAEVDETMRLRDEAHNLARKLNGGDGGILAHDDAPGYVLERGTAAADGAVPLWGQTGTFIIEASGMRVRIEMEGIFGTAGHCCYWLGFSAHAAELDRPFLSQTGYRSFLGIHADAVPGMTPDVFAAKAIEAHVDNALKGKLVTIEPRYRERREARS